MFSRLLRSCANIKLTNTRHYVTNSHKLIAPAFIQFNDCAVNSDLINTSIIGYIRLIGDKIRISYVIKPSELIPDVICYKTHAEASTDFTRIQNIFNVENNIQ